MGNLTPSAVIPKMPVNQTLVVAAAVVCSQMQYYAVHRCNKRL